MKKMIGTILCICFIISNAIIVGALEQQVNMSQTQKIPNNQFFHDENYDLIIITPDELKEDFEPLKHHKDSKGINTKIVGLNEIFDSIHFPVEGRDEAEKIKCFIRDSKENWNVHYVMLVGGKEDMPVRYSNFQLSQSSLRYLKYFKFPFEYPNIYLIDNLKFISDLYYADIYDSNGSFCSWDSNKNDIFGEVNGTDMIDEVDLYPDVCVGRTLCSNSTDVKTVVAKIIGYENNTFGKSWFKNLILCGGDTHTWIYGESIWLLLLSASGHFCRMAWEGEYTCDKVAELLGDYNPVKCYASGILKPNARRLTVDNINRAINAGGSFLLYSGHGFTYGFATHPPFSCRIWLPFPSMYQSSDVNTLDNGEKLPVAIFSACSCADFDSVADPIAWKFISHEKGGSIASLASTTVSLSAMTTYTTETYTGHLTMGIFQAYDEGTNILGEMWANSIAGYLDDENAWENISPSLSWMHYLVLEEWIILGDPSLKIGGYP